MSSNVTLFDAGKMFADIRTQQANVDVAEANDINTDYAVGLSVKQAYNSVLAAKESEAAALAQLATAQLQLETSIAKVNAGAANISDSLRSVVTVGNAQLAVLTAQDAFRTQNAALTRLVGTTYFVTAQLLRHGGAYGRADRQRRRHATGAQRTDHSCRGRRRSRRPGIAAFGQDRVSPDADRQLSARRQRRGRRSTD